MSDATQVKLKLRQRSEIVQQVIRIIATKRWVEVEARVQGADMTDLVEAAMVEWDQWAADARQIGITEETFAGEILKRLRTNPQHGWSQILRREVN